MEREVNKFLMGNRRCEVEDIKADQDMKFFSPRTSLGLLVESLRLNFTYVIN